MKRLRLKKSHNNLINDFLLKINTHHFYAEKIQLQIENQTS